MFHWIIAVAASTWGLVMAVAPVLQITRMLKRQSSDDVSVGYFCLLVPGFLLWVAHGLSQGDLFLVIPNAVATVTGVALIAIAMHLRKNPD